MFNIRLVLPLRVFGQVDFILAKRKYTRAMMAGAREVSVFDGQMTVKTLVPEDVIGFKVQALSNDPKNRFPVDAADIKGLLAIYRESMDLELVREYFRVFEKENLLDEWLQEIE